MSLPNRRLHRLKSYDYSQSGYYFVTVCTKFRRKLLSDVSCANEIIPTDLGQSVIQIWNNINNTYENIKTDCFCLMPNHIHGIIIIRNQSVHVSEEERGKRSSLDDIVRALKSVTTREFNKSVTEHEKNNLWQLSFYDEVIKSEDMLYEVRKYINENPKTWKTDEYYI
ncbi:MAG: transposase [Eubacteriales bacterium]